MKAILECVEEDLETDDHFKEFCYKGEQNYFSSVWQIKWT